MPRTIYSPVAPISDFSILPIIDGGTSANNAVAAISNLHAVPLTELGQPKGVAKLDQNGLIPLSEVPQAIINGAAVLISGPLSLGIGLTGTYTINNYVSTQTYTVTTTTGTVSVSGATITYTASLNVGQGGFTVNGVNVSVNIVDPGANPTVTGPSSLLENSQGSYTITNYDPNSQYTVTATQGTVTVSLPNITYTAPPGDGSTTLGAGFTINTTAIPVTITPPPVPIITGPTSAPINYTITLTISNYTPPGTYRISTNAGTISALNTTNGTFTFTAPNSASIATITVNSASYTVNVTLPTIATPTITSPVNGAANLGPSATIISSAFTMLGGSDTQKYSNWQLATDSAFTQIVTQSLNDGVNLTSWVVNNLLNSTTYYVRVQYTGQNNETSQYSSPISFTTKAVYAPTAIVSSITSGNGGGFGGAVSINSTGTIAIIGAYGEGAAYIYTNQGGTWTQTARIASGVANSGFGCAVSINSDGTIAIIGASGENTATGAAYIYTNQNGIWTQTARLASGVAYGYFGGSVSIDSLGTTAIIGASVESSGGSANVGAAYIYTNQSGTWTQNARLSSVGGGNFGTSVYINNTGTVVFIGSPGAIAGEGEAFIYTNQNGTWTQTAILASGVEVSYFGWSVSINSNGTIALIGAYGENAAYIYTNQNGTWSHTARLVSDVSTNYFGYSVSINSSGTVAIVGAYDTNYYKGAAYIYTNQNGTWTQTASITTGVTNGYDGDRVSINSDGTIAIIGAPDENSGTGAAYIAQ